jgi:hypothetical protein
MLFLSTNYCCSVLAGTEREAYEKRCLAEAVLRTGVALWEMAMVAQTAAEVRKQSALAVTELRRGAS